MDDRIRRDNSGNDEVTNSDSAKKEKAEIKESSIDIDSAGEAAKINPTAHKVKRFEVHIPESDDFSLPSEKRNDAPARVPAPPRRPAASHNPDRRVAPQGARRSVRPNGDSMPRKRTATGSPSPVSPEAQLAAQKAAERNSKERAKQQKQKEKDSARLATKNAKAEKKLEKQKLKREKNKNFGYNFAKGLLISCVCIMFIGTLVMAVSSVAFSFINDILVINDEDKNYSVTVEIPEGADYEVIFDILVDKGLVNQPFLTDFFCKFRHYDYESYYDEETDTVVEEAVEYLPGVYHIDADSGIENILESMLVYNNVNKDTVRLTFPEGWTISEIFEKLEKYDVCDAEKLYANLDIVADRYDFIKNIPNNDGRYSKAEGFLFPDTYDFYIGENASSVLGKLFDNFVSKWNAEYTNRLKTLGLSIDQVVAMASIIQAEAKDSSQMADISAVIHNRLNNSASYPTLDMDSTADYVKKLKTAGILSEVHYSMYIESYNTYSQIGLPPGAICNPGASAIHAALYPSDSKYFFFCHDPNGEIYFATTASEHQENVERVVYGAVGETTA